MFHQNLKSLMKNIIFIAMALTLTVIGKAQTFQIETEKTPDGYITKGRKENGLKEGLWVGYSNNIPLKFEEYKNGAKHGYSLENDEHGHPKSEGWFFAGKPVGKHSQFNHGNILKEENYKDGLLNGISTLYYQTGKIQKEAWYEKGVLNGTVKIYYESGSKLSQGDYIQGKREGVHRYFYADGTLQGEIQYKNDTQEGRYKEFHNNGKVALEGSMINGMREGEWKESDSNGNLTKIIRYKNDKELK